jgi:hypothetical protein
MKIVKLTAYLLFLSIIIVNPVYSDEKLFLISGEPSDDGMYDYPSKLFSVQNAKLVDELSLIGKDELLWFIRPFYDERIVVIKTHSGCVSPDGEEISHVYSFSMDNPSKLLKYNYSIQQDSELKLHLISNDKPMLGIYLYGDEGGRLMGIDLLTGDLSELGFVNYKYVKVYGIPGAGVTGGDYISLLFDLDSGYFWIDANGMRNYTNISIPKNLKKDDRCVMFLNNINYIAVSSIGDRVKEGLGSAPFWIFDKSSLVWDKVVFKGGSTAVRGFNDWLAGSEIRSNKTSDKDLIKILANSKQRKTGISASRRYVELGQDSNGIMFAYNMKSKKIYKIYSDDQDSEILYIDNKSVYYRVSDSIFKENVEKNKLSVPALIVKDDAVKDIHWAFIGSHN